MNRRILLDVSYQDNTGKCWADSYIKNKIVPFKNTIHETVAEAIKEIDGNEMSYKGKPQSTMYCDLKDGGTKAIGYIYRVKISIQNDTTGKWSNVPFDAWVSIKEVVDFPIVELN